jgi:hypothetical protein
VAVNDTATTSVGTAVTIAVLANDSDPDGDPLTVTGTGPAAHGTTVVNADGTIRYTPASGFAGTDTFAYTISDGRGGTATATVTVTIVRAQGTITAAPNPITVCDAAGRGITTLTWTSSGATATEVHVGSPSGALFSAIGPSGSKATGQWVTNGTLFYLQNVSGGLPLTAANTLASVTVNAVCR